MTLRDISKVVLLSEELLIVGSYNDSLYGDDLYKLDDCILNLEVQAIYIDNFNENTLVIEVAEV